MAKKNEFSSNVLAAIILLLMASPFIAIGGLMSWYRAGIQADVYHRAGIQMSQWEVFIGAKTPERTIHISE